MSESRLEAGQWPAGYRSVFGVAEFRALFAVQALRVGGENIAVLALAVLVYDRSASAFVAAVVFMAGMLPQVVGGAFLISLADRLRPRPLLAGLNLFRFVVMVSLAVCGAPTYVAILALMLQGLTAPLSAAAMQALLRDLLKDDAAYVLGRSLFTMTMAGALAVSHAVGGILLFALSPYGVLWSAAGSCLAAAAISRLGLRDRPPRAEPEAAGNVMSATWCANRMLLVNRRVRGLLLAQWVPFSLAVGAEGVIVPYAAGLGRPETAGLLYSAVATGLFLGNLVLGRLVRPARQEALTFALALLTGLTFLFFAFEPRLGMALVLCMVASVGFAYELGLQRRFAAAIPSNLNGQAFGLLSTGLMTGQALCIMAAGAMAELMPPGYVMAISGGASVIAALVLARHLRPDGDNNDNTVVPAQGDRT